MTAVYEAFNRQVAAHSGKAALITREQSVTYGDLDRLVQAWASYLRRELDGARLRIGLLAEDPLTTLSITLAVALLDGVCVPSNYHCTQDQLISGWRSSDINLVVFEGRFSNKVSNLSGAGINGVKTDDAQADMTMEDDLELPTSFPWSDETDFLITLSSGSTGDPKPIVFSQVCKFLRAKQSWALYDLDAEDVVLCASPFYHSLGQRLSFIPLLLGATLVYLHRFTVKDWLEMVQKHAVTFTISVSTHLYALKDQLLQNAEALQSMRRIVTSSAPIDAAFKKKLFDVIGCDFYEIYGASEVAIVSNLEPKDATAKYATVGKVCDGIDVLILGEDGKPVAVNGHGEIACKSPLAFEGYYGLPELTEGSMQDGYFLTGDLGFIDEEGFLSYVSRKKDIIIVGGINVYPGDIEKVLCEHEAVNEASVIGIDDVNLGEAIIAVCVSHRTEGLERELRRLANKRLAAFQRPLKYVFRDSLPLTDTGKVSKIKLREIYGLRDDRLSESISALAFKA